MERWHHQEQETIGRLVVRVGSCQVVDGSLQEHRREIR